ncbi:MAG TPA: tRNA (adenosine(37)-N6)-threonylcarbamoyltransferase complex ATPase subunit type 1 TsaE [Acidimicrobiales bacterium]|nr:tRNA (adenosine(37)-N6)-threonylcarbamoyltransferase complex ATPase subunit type 1 TsaE [Acidimicrobiales bacterium]
MSVQCPMVVRSSSPEETRRLAGRLGRLVVACDVVLLGGDLGAGKTTFTQGLARALGVKEPVTSPTFTLMRSYHGTGGLQLLHADVYRLEYLQEIMDLGLPELLEEGAAAVVEWGDRAAPALLADYLEIRIEFGEEDDERILHVRPVGARWDARKEQLAQALAVQDSTWIAQAQP